MGVLKYFKVGNRRLEFESYVVGVPKSRAERIKRILKEEFGNRVKVRVVPSRNWKGY